MNRFTLSAALTTAVMLPAVAQALPGFAPPGTALADYDVATGLIAVSYNGVNNWYVESASSSLTGDAPLNLPQFSGLITDNDVRIGESGLAVSTGTDVNLGNVAATGLEFGDLTINWNAGLSQPLQTQLVEGGIIDFDFARINGPFVIDLATDPLNITLDASDSNVSGNPLDFSWDIDGQPGFEIFTDATPTLEIADVTATFGGVGVYPVTVGVGFFEGFDTASTTVTIINTIPEPTALALAAFGFVLTATLRRRRHASVI